MNNENLDRLEKRHLILKVLPHIIGWGIIFSFPVIFAYRLGFQLTFMDFLGHAMSLVVYAVVFYLNYTLLIHRYLFNKKRLWQFIAVNLVLMLACALGIHFWNSWFFDPPKDVTHLPPVEFLVLRAMLALMLTVGLSVAVRMTERWYVVESEKHELEKSRSEAELKNLKNQLNPHFLFNTLNNIYALIALNQDRAQMAVHDLSQLLRHVLYEEKGHFVALDKEIKFMHSYIDLMSLRLPDRVELTVDMPHDESNVLVAPLLFISLIENAFKHGVSQTEKSYIHISLSVDGQGRIVCNIENSHFPKNAQDKSGSGIGLENLRRRLQLLYNEKYTLVTEQRGSAYHAVLVLEPMSEKL